MEWVLLLTWFYGEHGLYYAGRYASLTQCETMGKRIDAALRPGESPLKFTCIQVPEKNQSDSEQDLNYIRTSR